MSRKRALRLVLAEAGAHAAIEAQEMTGKSINDLPEYFLSVFIARHVHQHFKTFTFSMEDTVKAICASEEIDEALISRPGKVDIVVRSQRTGNIRHIIKLKRSYNVEGHIKISRVCSGCSSRTPVRAKLYGYDGCRLRKCVRGALGENVRTYQKSV